MFIAVIGWFALVLWTTVETADVTEGSTTAPTNVSEQEHFHRQIHSNVLKLITAEKATTPPTDRSEYSIGPPPEGVDDDSSGQDRPLGAVEYSRNAQGFRVRIRSHEHEDPTRRPLERSQPPRGDENHTSHTSDRDSEEQRYHEVWRPYQSAVHREYPIGYGQDAGVPYPTGRRTSPGASDMWFRKGGGFSSRGLRPIPWLDADVPSDFDYSTGYSGFRDYRGTSYRPSPGYGREVTPTPYFPDDPPAPTPGQTPRAWPGQVRPTTPGYDFGIKRHRGTARFIPTERPEYGRRPGTDLTQDEYGRRTDDRRIPYRPGPGYQPNYVPYGLPKPRYWPYGSSGRGLRPTTTPGYGRKIPSTYGGYGTYTPSPFGRPHIGITTNEIPSNTRIEDVNFPGGPSYRIDYSPDTSRSAFPFSSRDPNCVETGQSASSQGLNFDRRGCAYQEGISEFGYNVGHRGDTTRVTQEQLPFPDTTPTYFERIRQDAAPSANVRTGNSQLPAEKYISSETSSRLETLPKKQDDNESPILTEERSPEAPAASTREPSPVYRSPSTVQRVTHSPGTEQHKTLDYSGLASESIAVTQKPEPEVTAAGIVDSLSKPSAE